MNIEFKFSFCNLEFIRVKACWTSVSAISPIIGVRPTFPTTISVFLAKPSTDRVAALYSSIVSLRLRFGTKWEGSKRERVIGDSRLILSQSIIAALSYELPSRSITVRNNK